MDRMYWQINSQKKELCFSVQDDDTTHLVSEYSDGKIVVTIHSSHFNPVDEKWNEYKGTDDERSNLRRCLFAMWDCLHNNGKTAKVGSVDVTLSGICIGATVFRCLSGGERCKFEEGIDYYGEVSEQSLLYGKFQNWVGEWRHELLEHFEPIF